MSNIHQTATKGPLSLFIQATTLFPTVRDAFNHTNSHGSYPIHGAAFFGKDDVIEYILKMGGDPNVRAKGPAGDGTPLHFAALNNHVSTMLLLLQYGADVDATDNKGYTPLHIAIAHKQKAARRLLERYPKNIILCTGDHTPLSSTLTSSKSREITPEFQSRSLSIPKTSAHGSTTSHASDKSITKKLQLPTRTKLRRNTLDVRENPISNEDAYKYHRRISSAPINGLGLVSPPLQEKYAQPISCQAASIPYATAQSTCSIPQLAIDTILIRPQSRPRTKTFRNRMRSLFGCFRPGDADKPMGSIEIQSPPAEVPVLPTVVITDTSQTPPSHSISPALADDPVESTIHAHTSNEVESGWISDRVTGFFTSLARSKLSVLFSDGEPPSPTASASAPAPACVSAPVKKQAGGGAVDGFRTPAGGTPVR